MSIPSLAILTRIREVLEDGRGSVRTITANTYGSATHQALSVLSDSLGSIEKPQVEPRIVGQRPHGARPPRQGSFTLEELDIDVRVVRDFDSWRDLDDDARTALHALASSDSFAIQQALTWPGNLTATEAATATGLVSGCLRYAQSSMGSLEFAGGQNGRLVTTHRFTGVVRVETPTS